MWRFFQYFQRFLTVLRLDGGIAFGIKQLRHAFPDMSIVVHQEHKFMVYSFEVCHREGLSDKESGKYQADWEATICAAFGLETALKGTGYFQEMPSRICSLVLQTKNPIRFFSVLNRSPYPSSRDSTEKIEFVN